MMNPQKINPKKLMIAIALAGVFILQTAQAQVTQLKETQQKEQQIRTTKSGIHYITGGIGHEEAMEIRQHAKNFTLNLVFSEGEDGALATAININIYNDQNEMVFRLKGAKPMLYVNLPAGNYYILATNRGEKLRHKLTIAANTNQKVILHWKDIDAANTANNL